MSLTRLEITDFRNLASIKFNSLFEGFNFLYGANGSGKTSVLEAIYYLSRGRSFRSSLPGRIINTEADLFSLFAQIKAPTDQIIPIGLERQRRGDTRIRIAGQNSASVAELVQLVPVLLLNSNCYNLLEAGPQFRRRYLDWGAFYLEQDFLRVWKQYERTLKQRNAALRMRASKKELEPWTKELADLGTQLNKMRCAIVEKLLPSLLSVLSDLLTLDNLRITYQPGWDETIPLHDALLQTIDKDIHAGFTQIGPHRADLKILVNQIPCRDILSRGQQKLFVCAMILAQGGLLTKWVNRRPIYLVDDLPAELDSASRTKLLALLSQQKTQVFVTAVEREALFDFFDEASVKMFHVKHGCVTEVT